MEKNLQLYSWGVGQFGQLGIQQEKLQGKVKFSELPQLVEKIKNPIQISTFSNFTLILLQNGTVMATGSNRKNQCGNQTNDQIPLFTQIQDLNQIKFISCGLFHSLALSQNNEIYSCGNNSYGELGQNSNCKQFEKIQTEFNIINIFAGWNVSYFIDKDYNLFSCGKKLLNTFDNDQKNIKSTDLKVKFLFKKAKYVGTGAKYTCIITLEDELWGWGDNNFGQLAQEQKIVQKPKLIPFFHDKKIKSIGLSKGEKHQHTGCITQSNDVYFWGDPYKGQLGNLDEWNHKVKKIQINPVKIENFLQENEIPKKIIGGGIHSAILTENGSLYTFGCGSDGRLGHEEHAGHVYLYKESRPKLVNTFKKKMVIDCESSYYHMIAIVQD